jgi:large subunit ribosomal protein L29
MDAKELRDFSIADLQGRINGWKEEVFRSRFKMENAEARDTSVLRKLRRDIARAYTILNQKRAAGATETAAPAKAPVAAAPVSDRAEAKPAKAAKEAKAAPKAKKAKAPKAE